MQVRLLVSVNHTSLVLLSILLIIVLSGNDCAPTKEECKALLSDAKNKCLQDAFKGKRCAFESTTDKKQLIANCKSCPYCKNALPRCITAELSGGPAKDCPNAEKILKMLNS
ncbi:hypothetical protein EG68_11826 [Paragonimus skrjabini miyazakii]|uniref:Uncharacterized protein n=1 Tax=Paragonimus skrjabini miyazakii TaxID=59628 RepID=A0A8S9YPG8_9TREM|nr:hypothetical protein EG68_11826 [Paragonimus skrjabini miyazakii]